MDMVRLVRRMPTKNELDDITDPVRLGHALTKLDTHVEEAVYIKNCRISGLASMCVRERILGYREDFIGKRYVNIGTKLMYDIGNAYHEWIQNDVEYFGERRIGWWECRSCGHKVFGKPPRGQCGGCKGSREAVRYKEHEMRLDSPYYVQGHPDMFLECGNSVSDVRVAEVKSMKGEMFDKLTMPLADNVYQLHGYMMFLPYDESLPIQLNPNRGIIVYITKKAGGKGFPIKAFHVQRDPAIVKAITNDLLAHKRGIEDDNYNPPLYQECERSSFGTFRAKSCPMLKKCMEEKRNGN